ncbi:MAG: hypothetical protein ACKV0T_06855 [Planctomycetales bacterium]
MSLVAFALLCCGLGASRQADVIVVVGADGEAAYGKQFQEWAGRWKLAAERGDAAFHAVGLEPMGEVADRELLRERLTQLPPDGSLPVWLVLIGHGTFDGRTARFNLRGDDVTAKELAEWLKPLERPLAVVNCSSSSGPFLNELSGANRVIITATRSGHEYNFARFGDFLSAALLDPAADLDKDEQTSLLEAFLLAAAHVREYYASNGRLVTEHPLVDDNGDRLGTPADWFRGFSAVKRAKEGAAPDGREAAKWRLIKSHQELRLSEGTLARREELEWELSAAKQRKSELSEAEYLDLLEPILLEIARLYDAADEGAPVESPAEGAQR